MAEWYKAKTSFFGSGRDGIEVDVAAGQVVRSDHPGVAGREHLFEPLEDSGNAASSGLGRRITRGHTSSSPTD